ncbi:MAG: hypothetical protein Q8L87_13775 [Anaerolineales bacterium]|jgi:hypothetical protein|nr:hypothetical protein [Anaerolineales bacterium]
MVTDEKIYSVAWVRYRLGSVFIWLGVLVWAPFILLRIMGEQPSMSLYLPLHLLGVMGGSRLRAFARKELGMPSPTKNRLQMFGHGLVWAGILVWAPYYYLKIVAGQPVDVMDYLPFHLICVLSGVAVLGINYYLGRKTY